MFSLPWVHPLIFHRLCQSPSKPCFFTRGDLCILWLPSANFCLSLSSLLCSPEGLVAPLLALLPTTHPHTEIKICLTLALGGSPISWRPQTSISYHNPAHLSPKLQSGLVPLWVANFPFNYGILACFSLQVFSTAADLQWVLESYNCLCQTTAVNMLNFFYFFYFLHCLSVQQQHP